MCPDFCHGDCFRTNEECKPANGIFPGCGARYISLPTSGAEFTMFAKNIVKVMQAAAQGTSIPNENDVFAAIQVAMHNT
jgi:hypothetical protein